jgi:hypothetical protein
VGEAEGDHPQTVEHRGDAQTAVGGGEPEELVGAAGEPHVEDPGGRQHHGRRAAGPQHQQERLHHEDHGQSKHQHPQQESAEQHSRGDGGRALKEQADAASQRDERAEIDQDLLRGCGVFRDRVPHRGHRALDEAHDPETDHGQSKDRVTPTLDAHRPLLL